MTTSAPRRRRVERALSPYLAKNGTSLVAPAGMGDLLPPDAAERRALSRRILRSFELAGYELVTPPVFEHAEVVRRGNELFDNRDLLRFLEPESGEVAVLRPDITPQVARIIATRLRGHPPPIRLCYEGRVFRRHRGRARNHRQITQVGAECVGVPGPDGDTEILALLIEALDSVGLKDFLIELSDATLVRALLETVPDSVRGAVTEALSRKDAAMLSALGRKYGVGRTTERGLLALMNCYGGREVIAEAAATLRSSPARTALAKLEETSDRLSDLGHGRRVVFDLGETRGWEYYTGLRFTVLVDGPGEALGQGGRYDRLLARFGRDAPATGFALALGHLQWTLRRNTTVATQARELRLGVGGKPADAVRKLADGLRQSDVVAATLPFERIADCLAFARAWGYDAVLLVGRGRQKLVLAADGSEHAVDGADLNAIRRLTGRAKR